MIKAIPEDLKRKVAQLFIIRASGHTFDNQREYPIWEHSNGQIKELLEEGVGGVIFFGGSIYELNSRCKIFNEWATSPLLLCADVEEGIGQRFEGASRFIPPMGLGHIYKKDKDRAIQLAETYGRLTADQAKISGLNWILAPVCDVNTNPANPVINIRAWGEDAQTASSLACAFHRGVISSKILSCAKHFPGHGDTGIDSHLDLPIIENDINRLEEIDLIPFRNLISEGISSIMIGHLLMTKIDSIYPSSLSQKVIIELLRNRLRFDGLIVTDALIMSSISKRYQTEDAALLAFEAGADLILMPNNAKASIRILCEAFISGRIPFARLEESLDRRKRALDFVGINFNLHSLDNVILEARELDNYTARNLSIELIEKSIKLNSNFTVNKSKGINLLRIDDFSLLKGNIDSIPAISLPKEAGYSLALIHNNGINPWQDDKDEPFNLDLIENGPVFLQIFFRGKPFANKNLSIEPWNLVVKQLQRVNRVSGLCIYGSHYLWQELVPLIDPGIPAAYSPANIPQAQVMVLNKLFNFDHNRSNLNYELKADFTD